MMFLLLIAAGVFLSSVLAVAIIALHNVGGYFDNEKH